MKILIIEDDIRIAKPIKEDLENQHYLVDIATDGELGYQMAAEGNYDLLLLDLQLPKIDGYEVCRLLRTSGYIKPILMLTARSSKQDKIAGLDSGADDYLVKPFDLDELSARVRALLRRGSNTGSPANKLKFGDLCVDLSTCVASFANKTLDLTPTEYRLLIHFLRHPKRIFNRNELIESLWFFHETPGDAVIKAHIKGLRNKLAQAGAPKDIIETVYGFGYRLKERSC